MIDKYTTGSIPLIGHAPDEGVASAVMADVGGYSTEVNQIMRAMSSGAISTMDEELRMCDDVGAIPPPHPPEWYVTFWRQNTALHPVVESLVTNVDKHGYRIEPLDLQDKRVSEAIETQLFDEAIKAKHGGKLPPRFDIATLLPNKESVELRKQELHWHIRLEERKVKRWLAALCPGISNSLTKVRECKTRDQCVTGNGYIEVVNDLANEPAEWNWLRAAQMRIRPILKTTDGHTVQVKVPIRTEFGIEHIMRERSFRTFVQVGFTKKVFYKEFGDPRILSRHTGQVFSSRERLQKAGHQEATSVIWFPQPHPSAQTIYGMPPWLAADAEISGLRDSQRVNADLFNQKAIPQMVVLINGARADDKLVNTVKEYMKGVNGIENWHRVLILSAAPAATASNARVTIDIKPLRDAIPQDALFLSYQERAAENIRKQFRIAKLLLGIGENINRATSEAILQLSEEQVFGPLRNEFDEFMNDFFAYIGFVYWRFVSNSAVSRSPLDATTIASAISNTGALSINELRAIISDIINKTLPRDPNPYADIPTGQAKNMVALKMLPGEEMTTASKQLETDSKVDPVPSDEVDAIIARARAVVASTNEPRGFVAHTSKGRTLVIMLPEAHAKSLLDGNLPPTQTLG